VDTRNQKRRLFPATCLWSCCEHRNRVRRPAVREVRAAQGAVVVGKESTRPRRPFVLSLPVVTLPTRIFHRSPSPTATIVADPTSTSHQDHIILQQDPRISRVFISTTSCPSFSALLPSKALTACCRSSGGSANRSRVTRRMAMALSPATTPMAIRRRVSIRRCVGRDR
jgi:hypothetical protein